MDKHLLEKFFINDCTALERQTVITWILDPANDRMLKSWMQEHWDLFTDYSKLEKPDIEKIWQNLQADLKKEMQPPVERKARLRPLFGRYAAWAAACILIAAIAALYWLYPRPAHKKTIAIVPAVNTLTRLNTGEKEKIYPLEDGSRITLSPGSKIIYPSNFAAGKRSVTLEGEAFFEVSKDPARPFFVHYNQLIIQVLGTSFSIRSVKGKKGVEVAVHTGKVSVYEDGDKIPLNAEQQKTNGVIITPNQKVTYYSENRHFVTALVAEPQAVPDENGKIPRINFVFDETPLSKVLQSLEKEYGLEIEVEEEDIRNCPFTGDISQQSLYNKLELICKSLQADYEIKGTKVLIKGKGCSR